MENILLYAFITSCILLCVLTFVSYTLHNRIKKLTTGKTMSSLEDIIVGNHQSLRDLEKKYHLLQKEMKKLKEDNKKNIQHLSIEKFDALGGSGGRQSFSFGLLDAYKNGIVISSLYARESMSIFAKEIKNGKAVQKLSEEEKKVIQY